MSSFTDLHAAAEKTAPAGLLIVDDSHATGWGVLALCGMGALTLAWLLLRAQVSLPGAEGSQCLRLPGTMTVALLMGMLSACRTPTNEGVVNCGMGLAVDAKKTAVSRYVRQVNARVEQKWQSYSTRRPNNVAYGSLNVDYYVNEQGKVEGIHVHNDKDTNPELTRFTVQALKDVELPRMPAEVIAELTPTQQGRLKFICEIHHLPQNKPRSDNRSSVAAVNAHMTSKAPSIQALEKELNMLRGTRSSSPVPATMPPVAEDKTPKGRYIRLVTSQVEKKWHIYRLLRRDGVTYGSLQVVFYVNKIGKVEDLRVVNDKDSNRILTAFTLQAIRDAEIPPMPADVIPLLPKNDRGRLKIEYNVLIY